MVPFRILPNGRDIGEWLCLLAALLVLGGYGLSAQHHEYLLITEAEHAEWQSESLEHAWMYGVFFLTTTLSLFFHQRRRRIYLRLVQHKDKALRASDARLHSFFNATPDALLISDTEGIITMANRQVQSLLGYPVGELMGKSIDELIPSRYRNHHPQQRAEYAQTPSARRMGNGLAVKARRKDGSECDVEVSLSRIETDEGLFFASALRDITERKESEEQVRQLVQEQRLIFDNASVGIMMLQSRKIIKCNQQIAEMFGFTGVVELEGKTTEALYCSPEQYRAVDEEAYARLAESGFTESEAQMRRQDGSDFWVIQTGRPLDRNAVLSGYSIWIYTDITARRQAQADLRIAATAFEVQFGMMVTDGAGVILRVNQAFTDTSGYSATDVVGQTPRLLKSGRHDASFYRSMWESITRTGQWQGEIWDRRKNGEVYPKWLTISTVRDERGAVSHYVGVHQDITDRKLAEDRINELAFYDQLTGLPNRTLLMDRLNQAVTTSSRNGIYGALLFIDLDNFKTLNDTLGHDMGDLLLMQVAQRLSANVREGDTVARLGGDEFMVILAGLSGKEVEAATDTKAVVEKIRLVLGTPYQIGPVTHVSTASIGVTLFGNQNATVDDLMKQADLAMYRSKETGRNIMRFFDPAMQTAVIARVALENDLRSAVADQQFVLHYQAQVTGAGRVTGAEVLVRWQHPVRGMVSPSDFIPLAEQTGVIVTLGQWVLETACLQLAQWKRLPAMAHLTLAVNVSANQLAQSDFVEQVLTVLEHTGANPALLKLELTESLLVGNIEDIIGKMFALKARGVGFALDDFGTGYSSLSYLNRLPLDQLKIDQSFVRDVLINPSDAAIARTIIALAQSLGLGIIAEGVETQTQRDFLSDSGCHAYQGYFFSRPLPVAGFEAKVLQGLDGMLGRPDLQAVVQPVAGGVDSKWRLES